MVLLAEPADAGLGQLIKFERGTDWNHRQIVLRSGPRRIDFRALLHPSDDLRLQVGHRIAVLAPSYADAAPSETTDVAKSVSVQ